MRIIKELLGLKLVELTIFDQKSALGFDEITGGDQK